MRRHPHLYEINARVFVNQLSQKYGRRLELLSIPDEEWKNLAALGFDLVWLMGVWQRSPLARTKALEADDLRRRYEHALPGWTVEDVAGSPYAVYEYRLDDELGRPEDLALFKTKLNRFGLGLILDFVPNHLAADHPWTLQHPDWFVRAAPAAAKKYPDGFFLTPGKNYLAHGRDPNFPPWSDTVQVHFFSKPMRQALIERLLQISEVCDGVRCDMAMLALNDIFRKVWGAFVQEDAPKEEFWKQAIAQVQSRRRDFLFLAESYWDLERKLLDLGFDFTYDKILYDRLKDSSAANVRIHLIASPDLRRGIHFIENHDEERAAACFGRKRSRAAAIVVSTLPGLRFFHEGQLDGRTIERPVQLVRAPDEVAPDPAMRGFYERLLRIGNAALFHAGEFKFLEPHPAHELDESFRNLLAWTWTEGNLQAAVFINYSGASSQARFPSVFQFKKDGDFIFKDALTEETYVREVRRLQTEGFFVSLPAWGAHCFISR